MTGGTVMVMTAAQSSRAYRFGWMFAAVWLVYLYENVKALLAQPNLWWRGTGLVAVAAFGVTYLVLARLARQGRIGGPAPATTR